MPERERDYHHGRLREALVEQCRAQVEAAGAGSFSLAKAASALGVSSAAPYHHFRDREQVLAALGEQVYLELLADVRTATLAAYGDAPPSAGSVRAATSAASQAFLRYSLEHPRLFALAMGDYRPVETSAPFALGRATADDGQPLLCSTGLVDPGRVVEFGAAVYVALRGVAAVAQEAPRLVPLVDRPAALLESLLDALFHAFAPADGGPDEPETGGGATT